MDFEEGKAGGLFFVSKDQLSNFAIAFESKDIKRRDRVWLRGLSEKVVSKKAGDLDLNDRIVMSWDEIAEMFEFSGKFLDSTGLPYKNPRGKTDGYGFFR
jgi:hypothetical protein